METTNRTDFAQFTEAKRAERSAIDAEFVVFT
jgi:hypothetical protein